MKEKKLFPLLEAGEEKSFFLAGKGLEKLESRKN